MKIQYTGVVAMILAMSSVVNISYATSSETNTPLVRVGDSISVDYTGYLTDGTIFDSSIESVARKSANYTTGRTYAPLTFTVGKWQMIKGFEQGVIGMKVGKMKRITIKPEAAYGTGGTLQEISKQSIMENFTITQPIKNFQDRVSLVVSAKSFLQAWRKLPVVGEIVVSGGVSAKTIKVDNTNIYLEVDNVDNPFYGKKLAVGLEGNYQWNTVKIIKLQKEKITLQVINKSNPFHGKVVKVGQSVMYNGEKITIKKIGSSTVTIERAHPLSGKTLIFYVKVLEIYSSTSSTSTSSNIQQKSLPSDFSELR